MSRHKSIYFAWLALFLIPSFGAAYELCELYDQIVPVARDFHQLGSVCEEAARIQLEQDYPAPGYAILTGVQYYVGRQVGGDLDVVVIRRSDRQAVLVAEVKCQKKMRAAHSEALSQLGRFSGYLRSGANVWFRAVSAGVSPLRLQPADFPAGVQYLTIAQDGAERAGFDLSLGFTLKDIHQLQNWLVGCHDNGDCDIPR